jgi:hypothetical protein
MVHTDKESAMKLPRPFVTKLSLATVLAASASLGWAIPATMADKIRPILPDAEIVFKGVSGPAAHVTFSVQPNPGVFASADYNPAGPNHGSNANIDARYAFIVDGPTAANLDFEFNASYDFIGLITGQPHPGDNTFIFANVELLVDFHSILQLVSPNTGVNGRSSAGGEDNAEIDQLSPGDVHFVDLIADVGLGNANPDAFGSAFLDPVITFAPGFDSTGFSLEFSPGVGNEPDSGPGIGTPEPSTLVMSSIAFVIWGVVWAYRQRQRTRGAA